MNGLSALRDSSFRHQNQSGVSMPEEEEPAPQDQLAKGELEADMSHEQKLGILLCLDRRSILI